jgi:hypothetical protein
MRVVKVNKVRIFCLLILLISACIVEMAFGSEYFVGRNGNDTNIGSRNEPWATLEKASQAACPGDTVSLLPGEYAGILHPARSGCPGAPITFRAAQRQTTRLTGDGCKDRRGYILELSNLSYINIEGLHIRPGNSRGGWLRAIGTQHVTVEDCLIEETRGGLPFLVEDSEDFTIRDSTVRRHEGKNMVRFANSSRILIEGNAISRAGHCPLQFYPHASSRYVVVRGNVFHGGWGRNFEFFGTPHVLFEHNIVSNAYDGGRSASGRSKFNVDGGIFRFNRVFRNWSLPISCNPYSRMWCRGIRFYNNVFHDNYESGIYFGGLTERIADIKFVNNVFFNNDAHGSGCQIRLVDGKSTEIGFWSNVISGGKPESFATIWYGKRRGKILTTNATDAKEVLRNKFRVNYHVAPLFVDALCYDHSLGQDSTLRNAGSHLTRAVGSGQGKELRVEDARYFYDGFGIEGEVGDLIAVGKSRQRARVTYADYSTNTLQLDRSVSWNDGDWVSLPWEGVAPDIGVYEDGNGCRISVQVDVKPFLLRPGQEVSVRSIVRGIEPAGISWDLGDGSVKTGSVVLHRYHKPDDYPIRVCVTDRDGFCYYGTGYVVVEQPKKPDAPLVHSTFGENDEEWWWRWKTYRPKPAASKLTKDGVAGGRSLFVYAPHDGGILSAKIHPVEWDINSYPFIFVRYRIKAGTHLAMYLIPFQVPAFPKRSLCVARTEFERLPADECVGNSVLFSDGNWHELTIDIRVIKKRWSDVKVLKGFWIHALDKGRVKRGDGYWIDEFAVLPLER